MVKTQSREKKQDIQLFVRNKRAYHDYTVMETTEAGVVLFGSEVKAIRDGKVQITDGYATSTGGELFLLHVKIQEYAWANRFNHPTERARKLLLHKKEILKLAQAIQQQGQTLLPLEIYQKDGMIKILLGLCKGKRQYDKRVSEKEKDTKRELARAVR